MKETVKRAASLAFACVMASGCGVAVRGDFDGVPFAPDSTVIAVADRHDLLLRNGSVTPVLKSDGQQKLHVLLTAGRVDPSEDWRRYGADSLLELKRELATSDGLFLKGVPLARFEDGDTLTAVIEDGASSGDFDLALGTGLPAESSVADQGLGSKVRVIISPRAVEARPRGGSMTADVEIQREREAGQDGDVATGTVQLSFSTALLPERLTEANLTVAEPVLTCMQANGPARAGACRDVDALPYVDETGIVP